MVSILNCYYLKKEMTSLCIIPARGGSKRIPKKNIKSFLGKPIIAYSIEAALKSKLFDEVMVSTDDITISKLAEEYGAKVPFLRSDKNANDFAVLADVLKEVLNRYNSNGLCFGYACYILPTAPFVNNKKLLDSFNILRKNNFDSVFPVQKFSFPIQRALQIKNGKIEMVNREFLNTRSQDLPLRYFDSGQFYWLKVGSFLEKLQLYSSNSGSIIISELEAQDIDTETDWKLAELKYKLLNEISK